MKEYKTFNQQLTILRNRGLIVPTDGKPKRFLEQENYYNVINGYKDLFLLKDTHGKPVEPETYLSNAHFNDVCDLSKCPRYDPACVQGLIISMSIQAF